VIAVIVAVVVVLVAGAALPLLSRARRERLRSNDEAIAARARHARLGYYVEDPGPVSDDRAGELLGKARERWVTCGGLLAKARSEKDFTVAHGVADEGMDCVRSAYDLMGKPL
jgi:hypothetical protein